MKQNFPPASLTELMTSSAMDLLSASGSQLINQIGLEVVRGVVLDVLTGKNLRSSTEALTRRRIGALNLAAVEFFLNGSTLSDNFIVQLPKIAAETLTRKRLSKAERWLAQWVLGLTDKAYQNVLRDDPGAIADYRDNYISICNEVVSAYEGDHGNLTGEITLDSGQRARLNWLFMIYLLSFVGSQTLSIRGSEKSAYGKLFEKLVLGSLLSILGFKHIPSPPSELNRVFWLSSRGERRESDATLLYKAGKGIRFDIGFIGRGNPEISLDKVTRFEREIVLGRSKYYMATIILVDRIGARSRIEQLAENVEGTIIQMSASYWPKQVANVLQRVLGYKHDLVNLSDDQVESYLSAAIQKVPIEEFIGLSPDFKQHVVNENAARYNLFEDD